MNLNGKTAVVTGGARGIGKAIALELARAGANLVIADLAKDQPTLDTVAEIKALGVSCELLCGDITNPETAKLVAERAVSAFGSLDILVNNAGITRDSLLMRMSDQDWDMVLDINLKGAFYMIRGASRQMLKQKGGTIINISSVIGITGNAGQANYAASKSGLIGLSKSVAKEFAGRGVTCNVIAPGFIETEMTKALPETVQEEYKKGIPLGRFGTPSDVARVAAFLASDNANYLTGQIISVDGGLFM